MVFFSELILTFSENLISNKIGLSFRILFCLFLVSFNSLYESVLDLLLLLTSLDDPTSLVLRLPFSTLLLPVTTLTSRSTRTPPLISKKLRLTRDGNLQKSVPLFHQTTSKIFLCTDVVLFIECHSYISNNYSDFESHGIPLFSCSQTPVMLYPLPRPLPSISSLVLPKTNSSLFF